VGRKKALTPEEFRTGYLPYKAQGLSEKDIAKAMGLGLRTYYRYLDDPDYVILLTQNGTNAKKQGQVKGCNRADKLIKEGYSLFEQGIKSAKKDGDFDKARRLIIDALKIAKAEADIKRVFNMFIDARDQSVNVVEIRAEVERDTARAIFDGPMRCPECGADVSGPLLARHTDGGDVE